MTGRIVRAGWAVLAAVALAAGGGGAAVAQSSDFGSGSAGGTGTGGTGGTGGTPWWVDEFQSNTWSICGDTPHPMDPDPCYRNRDFQTASLGDYRISLSNVKEAHPGDQTGFDVSVWADNAAFDGADPDVGVTSITFRPPKSFEFLDVMVHGWRPGETLAHQLDKTVDIDEATGDVTLTAPAGGWKLRPRGTEEGAVDTTDVVSVTFLLRAPERAFGEAIGATFDGIGAPASEGWLTSGETHVLGGVGNGKGGFPA